MSVNSESSGSTGAISRSHSEHMGLVLEPRGKCWMKCPKDISIQAIPILSPNGCKYFLRWAIWIPIGISGPWSLGHHMAWILLKGRVRHSGSSHEP